MATRSDRRTRRGVAALTAAITVLALVSGCSASSEAVTASMVSPERPAASELAPDPDVGGPDDFELPDLDLPDLQIPGLGELGDLGGEQFGKCFDLLFAYSQLVALAMLSGGGSDGEMDEVLGELEESIPAELSDELRIVAEALSEAGTGDLLDPDGALSDPEFLDANDAITAWLTTECVEGDGA